MSMKIDRITCNKCSGPGFAYLLSERETGYPKKVRCGRINQCHTIIVKNVKKFTGAVTWSLNKPFAEFVKMVAV